MIGIMATLDEQIKKTTEKLEKLKRQDNARKKREQEKQRAIDTRRKIIAGAILIDVFPQFGSLQPQKNNEQNYIEFAPLANFLKCIADDKELVARLEELAKKKAANK